MIAGVSIAGGMTLGALAVAHISRSSIPAPPPAAPVSTPTIQITSGSPAQPAINNGSRAVVSSAPPPLAYDAGPIEAPDYAAVAERHQEAQTDLIARHDHESVDSTWARKIEPPLNADLQKIAAKGGFTVRDVDCRTTMCTASVEWGSYQQAQSTARSLYAHGYPGCASQLYLPEPSTPASQYESTLILDCEEGRISQLGATP